MKGLARYRGPHQMHFLPSAALPEFCPYAKFFGSCAAAYAHDQFFALQADAQIATLPTDWLDHAKPSAQSKDCTEVPRCCIKKRDAAATACAYSGPGIKK